MTRLPIIGITTDYKEKENTYSKYPWFALRRHYSDCLHKFGCTPVILPITETLENLDFLDGLLISGGDFDIDPKYYGEKIDQRTAETAYGTLLRNKIADQSMKTFKIKETKLSLDEMMKKGSHNHESGTHSH